MKFFDGRSVFRVQVSTREVEDFKRHWPCSGLPDCAVTFEFDKRNGDLVDLICRREFDGSAALALSEDAYTYGHVRVGNGVR